MLLAPLLLSLQQPFAEWPDSRPIDTDPRETHLRNIRQLTFGGENAEAYWSPDGKQIVWQSRQPGFPDEQIFVMNADGSAKRLVSTGKGRCTCSYFSPDSKWIYFSSTHATQEGPQPPIDMSKGYVWMVNPEFRLYKGPMSAQSSSPLPVISKPGFYVAETTIDPRGRYMAFTSDFEGDLEIYRADLNGRSIKRLTKMPGYDGGPFVSWDGSKIVYRRDNIQTQKQLDDYRELLKQHLVRPSKLEIWIMDANGGNKRQITRLDCASFAPFLHPDGTRVIFSSNFGDTKGREFELWMIGVDGHRLERITYAPEFDGFPMFTRDGKKLVFASNRHGSRRGETNIFVADWVD